MNNIIIKKIWDNSDNFEIEVIAQSDYIYASTTSYTNKTSVSELANRLISFPLSSNDRYIWKNGIVGDSSTPFISLEFLCQDKLGHIIVEVYMELDDGGAYSKHNCCFFVQTEVGVLNQFGRALAFFNDAHVGETIELNHTMDGSVC